MKNSKFIGVSLLIGLFSIQALTGCGNKTSIDDFVRPEDGSVLFDYEDNDVQDVYGSKTNSETIDYSSLKVNTTAKTLRDDFAYGVDASMVYACEKNGGVYYNEDGKEQDIFQIMHNDGVNFIRLRIWADPEDASGNSYGGGENNLENDLAMAKRAQAADMNILLDFHYSDFWADPDTQYMPKAWQNYGKTDIENAITTYTTSTLQSFKDNGINVDAVQIGNEINNGFLFPYGKLSKSSSTSWDKMARLLGLGIAAAKSVFPSVYSIIHLAEGGDSDVFQTFFQNMEDRNLDYDIVGASYYPYWHGPLSDLQANLDNISSVTGKPVMVMETAWGFTNEANDYSSNIYNSTLEDAGGYVTSVQAQATCIADIANVLSKVPDNMGLGMFYWDADWIPAPGAGWATAEGQSYNDYGNDAHASLYTDGLASWTNQALFSYSGKALPSLSTYKYLKDGTRTATEVGYSVRDDEVAYTLNLTEKETLPTTFKVQTNLDALREYDIVWDEDEVAQLTKAGTYTVHGVVNGVTVTATVTCEQNFVVDPSYEKQTSSTVGSPWTVNDGASYVKIASKSEGRTGTNDLNYYYSGGNYSFDVSQTITGVYKGTYSFRAYIEGTANTNSAIFYVKIGETTLTCDVSDKLDGWSADASVAFKLASITDIDVPADNTSVTVGIKVKDASTESWGHIDDWSFAAQL